MLYINPDSIEVKAAEAIHYKQMRCFVRKKIGLKHCTDTNCRICKTKLDQVSKLTPEIKIFLSNDNNLFQILCGKPAELFEVNRQFWSSIFPDYDYLSWQPYFNKKHLNDHQSPHNAGAQMISTHIKQLNNIFNYSWFSNKGQIIYNAYNLTNNLGRNTCTYCNRGYTSTVIKKDGKRVVRPTLDHWFHKAAHPLLAISFYNLIPSCYTCNSMIKGTDLMNLNEHTHPYLDENQTSDFEFGYFYSKKVDQYKIFLKTAPGATNKSRDTSSGMHLADIYNTHDSELKDLLTIQKNYTNSYIDGIKTLFKGKLTTEEVYRIAFGTEYDKTDFHKRPLSKFKYDILKQMGLLAEKKK